MKCIMKWLMLCGLLLINSVFAGEREHHNTSIVFEIQPIETTQTQVVITNDSIKSGIATAIAAAQHQYSYGILGWQGSLAVGSYDNKTELSFGIAKRYNGILYNGSVGHDSLGAAINWTF